MCVLSPGEAELKGNINLSLASPPDYPPSRPGFHYRPQCGVTGDWTYISVLTLLVLI